MIPNPQHPLPQAIDLEKAVLGAMFTGDAGLNDAMGIIQHENTFYKSEHVYIFSAVKSIFSAGNAVDMLTVSQELRRMGKLAEAGGDFYLIELSQQISSSAHIEYHCRLLLQKYIARQIITFSSSVIGLAYDESTDVFELISRWQKEFDKVADITSIGRGTATFPVLLNDLKFSVERLSKNTDEVQLVGITTGFKRIDKHTGGYRNQDLIIVGGRPGMGKTAKVVKTAVANVKTGVAVGFISGEMSAEQLTARAVAVDTNFHLNQLLKVGFAKPEYFTTLQAHIERMNKYPLYIDDSGKMDINDVVITIKKWFRKYGIKLAIIDYIQLMTDRNSKGKNRNDELAEISRRLKLLAKELNIPVIALAQVSRECEKRGSSKRPEIRDIKDCGAIEQDADIIEFLLRPEYYGQDMESMEDEYPVNIRHLIALGANAELNYAKYRGGSTGPTLLKWIGDKTKYVDVEDPTDMDNEVKIIDAVVELPKISAKEAFDVDYSIVDQSNNDTPF